MHFDKDEQDYLINNNKARGILLYHEMGMGKSISAVALAEYYRKHDPDKNIVILLSKALICSKLLSSSFLVLCNPT